MTIRVHPWLRLTLWLLPLALLWFTLINHLRIEWSLNPQYAYGWAVPFLCLYLLWERLKTEKLRAETGGRQTENGNTISNAGLSVFQVSAFAVLAFLWFPTRLIEEANPEWRLVSWALALITVGLTLLLLSGVSLQRFSISHFVFPIVFFLVAVPWPTIIEGPLIQRLMRANVFVTIELMNLIGIPALQHGNVIEVATGVVGIDEACSGIRSFQATLMISLFLGELYRLSVVRRVVLCLTGFALSFGFNIIRTSLLTWVAARDGVEAIDQWHDPAGVSILVACFIALWLLGLWLNRNTPRRGELHEPPSATSSSARNLPTPNSETASLEYGDLSPLSPVGDSSPTAPCQALASQSADKSAHSKSPIFQLPASNSAKHLRIVSFALLLWLLFSEIAVEAWYRVHERNLGDPVTWTVDWPEQESTFTELPFSAKTEQFLRYDDGRNVRWTEEDGTRWQVAFLRWDPGRTALHLAKNHTPEVCLAAAGNEIVSVSELKRIRVNEVEMPFRQYEVDTLSGRLQVFYCLWSDRAERQGFDTTRLTYANRLEPVLAGRRLTGQRSLEVIISGIADPMEAEAALQRQLEKLIVVDD